MATARIEKEEVEAFLETVEIIEKNMPLIRRIYDKMSLKSDMKILKGIRSSEDHYDTTDYLGPQKCEECND